MANNEVKNGRGGARIEPLRRTALAWGTLVAAFLLSAGCTRESVRVALESQRRANEVQQAVFERMHEGLRVLLYRDTASRLAAAAPAGLNEGQKAAVEQASGEAYAWQDEELADALLRDLTLRLGSMAPKGVDERVRVALGRAWKQTWGEVFEARVRERESQLARDMKFRLEAATPRGLSDAQREAVKSAWNERDLVEFWAIQNERAKALRLAGVDAKLYSDQSVVDLLVKSMQMKGERIVEGTAGAVGEVASQKAEVTSQK